MTWHTSTNHTNANIRYYGYSEYIVSFYLGSVDLSGLKFIQFKTDLIAARALTYSYSI